MPRVYPAKKGGIPVGIGALAAGVFGGTVFLLAGRKFSKDAGGWFPLAASMSTKRPTALCGAIITAIWKAA